MVKIIIAINEDKEKVILFVKLESNDVESVAQVVANIKNGQSYKTKTGADVIIMPDGKHITTVKDGVLTNNLELLPTFKV